MSRDPNRSALFVIAEDWTFVDHRLHIAKAAASEGWQVSVICAVSGCQGAIEEAGVRVIPWSLSRSSLNPIKELWAVVQLFRAVHANQPEVVHAVSFKPVVYGSLVTAVLGTRTRVMALGGLGSAFVGGGFRARLIKRIASCLYRLALSRKNVSVILQNMDDVALLKEVGAITHDNVRLIKGSGVDTQRFGLADEPSGNRPLVVLPGRMLWDKGVAEFVDAARRLHSRGVAARFELHGRRDPQNMNCISREQLEVWEDEGVVSWHGHCDDMVSLVTSSAVVCLPSYREGLPKVLVEAGSCGRPVVAFDVPGSREVVRDGVNGFLVPFGDVEALTSRLETLLTDRKLRRQMGLMGRRLVEDHFAQEIIARETLTAWEPKEALGRA